MFKYNRNAGTHFNLQHLLKYLYFTIKLYCERKCAILKCNMILKYKSYDDPLHTKLIIKRNSRLWKSHEYAC